MTEFFRESQDLSPQDQILLELYSKIGCSVDSLAYTSEFEELVARLRAAGDARSRSEILRRLMTLRKAGKFRRPTGLGKRESPVLYDAAEEEARPARSSIGTSSITSVTSEGTQPRPRIGMNADYRSATTEVPAITYVTAGYYDGVMRAGGIPIVLAPLEDQSDVNDVLDLLDGLILVGGADLDLRHDGVVLHPAARLLDVRREMFDRMLVRMAAIRKLPVFGIGVGMQLLNVSQGGTLFMHIAEDLPRALPHLDPLDPMNRHCLEVEPRSLMERVYGEGEIRVNSMHHMAVDDVAPGFRVTARCPDGVVEAIESTDASWFAFGTQFHPEAGSASSLDLHIFEEFIVGCRQHSAMLEHASQ